MVEGHQCHRVAAAHRKLLVGRRFKASSPNGRFVDGASAIHDKPLAKIEVHGKNLFYFFSTSETAHEVVHIHFGMSGAFKTMPRPGLPTTPTTRLLLENDELDLVAHVSAMTVNHGDDEYYTQKISNLGPDPLREDANAEVLWQRIQHSKKPIGLVLMDQSLVAGLGNIYRAEVLFKARVHPEQPANTISREQFNALWRHSVLCLQRGFVTGSILTVEPEDAERLGPPWTRRYIYNHTSCGFCGGKVRTWDMANRTVYACEGCQVLPMAPLLPARRAALAAAQDAREFASHCASESAATLTPSKMTVKLLREALEAADVPHSSLKRKGELVAALTEFRAGLKAASSPAPPSQVADVSPELMTGAMSGEPQAAAPAAVAAAPAAVGLVPNEALELPADVSVKSLLIPRLKEHLRARNIRYPKRANKAELVELLQWAVNAERVPVTKADAVQHPSSPKAGRTIVEAAVHPEVYAWDVPVGGTRVQPGTSQFAAIASASAAAQEKARAGESRAVEHVALHDDAHAHARVVVRLAEKPSEVSPKRGRCDSERHREETRSPRQRAVGASASDTTRGTANLTRRKSAKNRSARASGPEGQKGPDGVASAASSPKAMRSLQNPGQVPRRITRRRVSTAS